MDLAIRDLESILGLRSRTLYGLIRSRGLPARKIGEQYRANRVEVLNWAISTRTTVVRNPWATPGGLDSGPEFLAGALERGRSEVVPVPATEDLRECIPALVETLVELDQGERNLLRSIADQGLAHRILEASVAVPHPNHPVLVDAPRPIVRVCHLQSPRSTAALFRAPVPVWCWILAPTPSAHLFTLAELVRALGDPAWRQALLERQPWPTIVASARGRKYTGGLSPKGRK